MHAADIALEPNFTHMVVNKCSESIPIPYSDSLKLN